MVTTAVRRWLWVGWGTALAVWTYMLLSPEVSKELGEIVPTTQRYVASKGLHVAGYAFFAIIVPYLTDSIRFRRTLWFSLVAHGILTECIQPYVGRSGEVRDAILDTVGVGMGLMLSRWLTTRRG